MSSHTIVLSYFRTLEKSICIELPSVQLISYCMEPNIDIVILLMYGIANELAKLTAVKKATGNLVNAWNSTYLAPMLWYFLTLSSLSF